MSCSVVQRGTAELYRKGLSAPLGALQWSADPSTRTEPVAHPFTPAPRHGAIDGGRSGRARGLDRTWTRRGVCGAASAADSHPTSARAWQALRESAETSITLRLYPRLMRSRLQTSPSCHQEARPPAPSSPRRQLQQPHRPRHRLSPHRPSLPHSSPPRQLPPRRRQSP